MQMRLLQALILGRAEVVLRGMRLARQAGRYSVANDGQAAYLRPEQRWVEDLQEL